MKVLFDKSSWQEIFDSVSKNKLRTIITVIGVVWGIFIYITLSGVSKGLDNGFEKAFKNVAKNSIFLWSGSTSIPHKGYKIGRQIQLTLDDAKIIKNKISGVQYIAPRNMKNSLSISRNNKFGSYNIYGDFPAYTKISIKKIYDGGRFINDNDIEHSKKVCVIGEQTKRELFEKDEEVIGKYININNIFFKVIGVHKYIEGGGFEREGDVFIPFTTYKNIYNTGDKVGWFSISAYDYADVIEVEKNIKSVLKIEHNVDIKDERAFGSFNLGEMFNRITRFSKGLTFLSLVVGIATIFAGVIGIGNILLISVKERTKELGIRRALGATPKEIKILIILESVFLSLTSGLIGIIFGALVLNIIDKATKNMDFPYANPTVPIPYVLGSVFIIVLLGTLIGLIPAQKAVSIKPIEALREE